jgi:hypothetical protein
MNWVAADLPARFRRGHSRRKLFATAGSLLTVRETRLAGPSFEEWLEEDS